MIFLIALSCVLIALLFGKREPVDLVLPDISIETSVDQYLEMQESNVAGVQPWARKEVIWANKKEEKTKFSIIFLHGFSASKLELAPFPNAIAQRLNANIYNARLALSLIHI